MSNLLLARGKVVVFEGLDAAGKSTQVDLLQSEIDPSSATFAHMPSGFSEYSTRLRAMLDDRSIRPVDPLAQQLGHLSSHAEAMPRLLELQESTGILLDRWWWSTVAYGWYGGDLGSRGVDEAHFRGIIDSVWRKVQPDLIVLFLTPFVRDDNNNPGVSAGYEALAAQDQRALIAPVGAPGAIHDWVVDKLIARGLLTRQ